MGSWRILVAAVAAQLGVSIIDQGIPTLTGFIKSDLHLSAGTAGLVVSAFAFGKIFGAYAAGVSADRFGERPVLLGGGFGAAVFIALAAVMPLGGFLPLCALAGFAGAASTPAGGRLVLVSFPANKHGFALGVRQTAIPVAGLIAAALLPWVTHVSSWRWSLGVAAALTALFLMPLVKLGRRDSEADALVRPRRRVRPMRDRNILLLTVWGCFLVSGQYALIAFLALDLHASTGIGLAKASVTIVVANAFGAAGRIGWGALSDRVLSHGRKPLLIMLTVVALVGALLLLVTPRSAPFPVFIVISAVAGLGVIGFQGLWVTMVAERAGPEQVGAAVGFGVTFLTITIAVSIPLYGFVADLAGSYRAIWIALAVVLALAFVPAVLVGEPSQSDEQAPAGRVG